MKALTPAALTPYGGSLRLLCLVFRTSNPQPRDGPERRFRSRLNALDGSCDPGFAMNEQARRTMPPKRVRHPAGCSFASSCSPPRIAATQSPSATCATTSHRTDFHPPDKTASQTHSFPRNRESRLGHESGGCPWIPAFVGMTTAGVSQKIDCEVSAGRDSRARSGPRIHAGKDRAAAIPARPCRRNRRAPRGDTGTSR